MEDEHGASCRRTLGKEFGDSLSGVGGKRRGLGVGQRVEIAATDDALVIRKLPAETSVEAMFAGRPPEYWLALYSDAFDWGPDRGREQVEQ
jgi:hypothetical protein